MKVTRVIVVVEWDNAEVHREPVKHQEDYKELLEKFKTIAPDDCTFDTMIDDLSLFDYNITKLVIEYRSPPR